MVGTQTAAFLRKCMAAVDLAVGSTGALLAENRVSVVGAHRIGPEVAVGSSEVERTEVGDPEWILHVLFVLLGERHRQQC